MIPFQHHQQCGCAKQREEEIYTRNRPQQRSKERGERSPWFPEKHSYSWQYNKNFAGTVNRQIYPAKNNRHISQEDL